MKPLLLLLVFVPTQFVCGLVARADSSQPKPSNETREGRLIIRFGETETAHYVFRDAAIPRPYFAHVKTPDGTQATRSHPPVEGKDSTDHATMHPGIWLAFGDLNGEDFWRNKASVEHVRFVETPQTSDSAVSFAEEKRYVAAGGREVCRELFRWKVHALEGGFLMDWSSTFSSESEFYFGDRAVGMTILCHPDNFRPSWTHARNYGFMAANPFGRKAMNKGDESKVIVKPGESLRLRYGIWIHATQHDAEVDMDAI